MSPLSRIALVIALAAVVGLFFDLPDRWFCGLLSLACMLGAADAVYRELTVWAVAFLTTGVMLAGAAVHAVYADARGRRQR